MKSATEQGDTVKGDLTNGQPFTVEYPAGGGANCEVADLMNSKNVQVTGALPEDGFSLIGGAGATPCRCCC